MLLNFDLVARYYNILSRIVFGSSIHNAQIQFLDSIPQDSNVLIIGGGSGKFLRELLLKCTVKKILYVEHSPKMIYLSRKMIEDIPERQLVEFRQGTEADIGNEEMFDVVITHCFLNLFARLPLQTLMTKINSHLKAGGVWLFSDFRISSNSFHKIWQALLLKTMYLFFRITAGLQNKTLEKFDDFFATISLVKVKEKFFYAAMINSVLYKKMK
jgi:tRNA (cmo5U34)-methyltransferase